MPNAYRFLVVCEDGLSDLGQVRPAVTDRGHGLDVFFRSTSAVMVCDPGETTFRETPGVFGGADQPFPFDPQRYRGLIMLGSHRELSACHAEAGWIGQARDSERWILGICHGAQMISHRRWRGVARQVDHQAIRPTGLVGAGALDDPVMGPIRGREAIGQAVPLAHAHGYTYDPPGEFVLSRSHPEPGSPAHVDAFRADERTYGLQFHPELDHCLIDFWRRDWKSSKARVEWPEQDGLSTLMQVGREILDAWVGLATR